MTLTLLGASDQSTGATLSATPGGTVDSQAVSAAELDAPPQRTREFSKAVGVGLDEP
jgi:hypothetical protein